MEEDWGCSIIGVWAKPPTLVYVIQDRRQLSSSGLKEGSSRILFVFYSSASEVYYVGARGPVALLQLFIYLFVCEVHTRKTSTQLENVIDYS